VIWLMAEILAAKTAVPIWEAAFPLEDMPVKLLYEAEKQLLHPEAITIPKENMWALRAYLDEKLYLDEEDSPSVYAGFTCWMAAGNVILGVEVSPNCKPETELDMEEWDASFHASLPYSGGAIWAETDVVNGPIKRREYWEWFLREAIPQAVSRFY
jgi:hypothetical protein